MDYGNGPELITMAVIAAAVISGCFGMNRGHPEPNPARGFRLEISEGDARFRPLSVGAQGEGCEVLLPDADANRTCLIATNVSATVIGGEAYGDLNEQRTPALDALIWKARSDGDVSVCQRGGLANGFLEECERAASSTDYEYEGDEVRVRVPIGGAEPNPTRDDVTVTDQPETAWEGAPRRHTSGRYVGRPGARADGRARRRHRDRWRARLFPAGRKFGRA